MKKLLLCLYLLAMSAFLCLSVFAEDKEANFFVVTYDEISVIQSKAPGIDLKLSTSYPAKQFYTFAGWSETPGATIPDYLPGDVYTEDRDLSLYAVLLEPFSLGVTSAGDTVALPTQTKVGCDSYYAFIVLESGYYTFSTIGTNRFSSSSPLLITKSSAGYSSSTVWGTLLYDNRYNCIGFSIAADLQAGTTYYLSFDDQGFDLNLLVEPQYSDPNPYAASSAVPRSVSVIADNAFEGCGFESFQVPAGTTSIGTRAFANCPNLRKVVISSANVTIADDAFAGCTDLLIVAPKNSTAHQYAKAHGLEFRALP